MEQTKNEPTKENKAAPDTGKPKKGREPLTEAQRLKRQKMIVLPAMVLVFIGAMWLIFAPSSGKEQQPGTDGYNTEMPDADKANRQLSLIHIFVLFVILYMVGIDQWICVGFGAASSSLVVWQTFALNARYGEHGLMRLGAARSHARYLINRRRIARLFKRQRTEVRQ